MANSSSYVNALFPHTGSLLLSNGIMSYQRDFTLDVNDDFMNGHGNSNNGNVVEDVGQYRISFVELSDVVYVSDLLQMIRSMCEGKNAQCALGKHEYFMCYQNTFYVKTESSTVTMVMTTMESKRDLVIALYEFYYWCTLLMQSKQIMMKQLGMLPPSMLPLSVNNPLVNETTE